LIETKDNHLSHLPLAVVIGTLSLHPEGASQIVDFKKAIAQINNAYQDLSIEYDFEALNIKQLSYPPAFNSINLGYKGKTSAPPCVENALRNICYALLWSTETACLDLKQINQDLKLNSNFLNFISKYRDGKNLTSVECAQDWLNLVSGLAGVEYFRTDYELCGHIENGLKVLNYLFGTKAQSLSQKVLKYLFGTKAQSLSQFLDQVSNKQKHSFAGNHGVGEITLKKGDCDFKILVNFAYHHAQADIQRPNLNQADIARSLIDQIGNDLSKCHQKIGLLLLLSKFKDLYNLNSAIETGKTNLAKLLIAAGANVNARDNYGRTVLLWAVEYGRTEIVKLLITEGADVNARDNDCYTALIEAVHNGHTVIAQLLIAAGADVHARDNNGLTALMYAARNGRTEIVKILIAADANVHARDNYDWTALRWAEDFGRTKIARLLIDAGAR
jgi:hypothetical protein